MYATHAHTNTNANTHTRAHTANSTEAGFPSVQAKFGEDDATIIVAAAALECEWAALAPAAAEVAVDSFRRKCVKRATSPACARCSFSRRAANPATGGPPA